MTVTVAALVLAGCAVLLAAPPPVGPRRPGGARAGWRIAAAAAVFVAFLAVGSIARYAPQSADTAVLNWFVAHRTPAATEVVRAVTAAADPSGLAVVTLVLSGWMAWRRRSPAPIAVLMTAVALASLAGSAAKLAFGIPRPPMAYRMVPVTDLAYPSGHVTGTAALVTTAALIHLAARPAPIRRNAVVAVGAVTVGAVAVSRLYLGVHRLSEVIGGTLLGVAVALLVTGVVPVGDPRRSQRAHSTRRASWARRPHPCRIEGSTHRMQHLILTYGVAAVFVLMIAESACIPVPSEVTMLLGGALAGGAVAGAHPNVIAVIAAGTLGNLVGSYLAWALGRYGGRPALHRWGKYVFLRADDIDRAQDWFVRRGAASVFWARLLPGIRTFISLPAGIAAMPPARFGVYTLAGCLPWTAALTLVGYAVGSNWHEVEAAMRGPSYVIAAVSILAFAALVVFAVRRRGRTAETAPAELGAESHVPAERGVTAD